MQRNTLFSILFIFTLSSFFFYNCAGTKNDADENSAAKDSQQQDLDDIEALLGISSDQSDQRGQDKGEKLDLLETDEMVGQQDNSMASAAIAQQQDASDVQKYKTEVDQLKNQVRQKDRAIINLENQVAQKNIEIEDLSSKGKSRSFAAPAGDISIEEYKDSYGEARAAFEARNYTAAIEHFEALLASSSSHSLSDNAQYWIGECHFALRQYDTAIIDFEKVLTFARSNKKADAQFKLGFCYLLKKDKAKAIEEFDRLRADFPNSKLNTRTEKLLLKY